MDGPDPRVRCPSSAGLLAAVRLCTLSFLLWMLSGDAFAQSGAGFALRFYGNGYNDIDRVKVRIDAPATPADVGTTDSTLEWWMLAQPGANRSGATAPGGVNWIFGNIIIDRDVYYDGDYGDYGVSLAGGRLAFGVARGNMANTIVGSAAVADGKWHHVAVTRRVLDGLLRIFVDGVIDAEGTGPTGNISYRDGRYTQFPNDPFLVLGAEKHDVGPAYPSFSGWLDELRISQVVRYTKSFQRPTQPFTPDGDTVALYHFDEGTGTVLGDTSGTPGGPSDGEIKVGGNPVGPVWVVSDAPLNGAPSNRAPVVNAGPDRSITLPVAATLGGTVTDDGLPNPPATTTVAWSVVSGPGSVSFANPAAPATTATFSTAGAYVLRLTASDSALNASDDVAITVNPPPPTNQRPVVNAGSDQTITLPTAATLDGTVTDDDLPNPPGAVTVAWSVVSGPGNVNFTNPAAVATSAAFSTAGTYVLRLTASDGALITSDDLSVTVDSAPPAPVGLVAAYGFNEGSGSTTADASGNGHTGTLVGPTWALGQFGAALAFDGVADSVTIADTNSLDLTGSLTIEAWIYPEALDGYRVVLDKTTTGYPSNYYLGTLNDEVSFGFYTAGWRGYATKNANLPLNSWTHIAVAYDRTTATIRLYVNGALALTASEPLAPTANGELLRIGRGYATEVFLGRIDEVRLYNRALSQAEIQTDMVTPIGP